MEFLSNLLTSLGSVTLAGFLFWNWINARLKSFEDRDKENRARIRDLEKKQTDFLEKEDHHELRKEDKEGIEKQLSEMRKDLKEMPDRILLMIKQFIK